MKKVLIIAVLSLCMTTTAQAALIQGYFSGLIDVNLSSPYIVDGASFAGSFLYDDESLELLKFSTALFGVDDVYSVDYIADDNYTLIGETYTTPDSLNNINFDGIPGGDIGILVGQFFLHFDDNGNFIADTGYYGSDLYFWTLTTRYNCDITSMTRTPYTVPVPEPSTMVVFSIGITGLVGSYLRKKK